MNELEEVRKRRRDTEAAIAKVKADIENASNMLCAREESVRALSAEKERLLRARGEWADVVPSALQTWIEAKENLTRTESRENSVRLEIEEREKAVAAKELHLSGLKKGLEELHSRVLQSKDSDEAAIRAVSVEADRFEKNLICTTDGAISRMEEEARELHRRCEQLEAEAAALRREGEAVVVADPCGDEVSETIIGAFAERIADTVLPQ